MPKAAHDTIFVDTVPVWMEYRFRVTIRLKEKSFHSKQNYKKFEVLVVWAIKWYI